MESVANEAFSIHSEIVVFPSRSGKKMVGYIDRPTSPSEDLPWVLMAPKYGQSKKNNLQMSYMFVANGMRVLRFDHTNHIGESEGEIVDYTLPGAVDDILASLDFLETRYAANRIVLQANSMSARCAIRAAALDARIARLVCLVGIVDFRKTITMICQKDIVDVYMDGGVQGVGDILGHDVNIDQFLEKAVDSNMHDLQGTIEDFKTARCDTFMFAAENDAWVNFEELLEITNDLERISVSTVLGAMHELMENPDAAKRTILQAIHVSLHGRLPEPGETLEELNSPDKKQLFQQNRIERERLRAVAPKREAESDFWHAYLDKYKMLESVSAYQHYLDLIGECLGSPKEGLVYFDCGCGNGMFGAWCLRDILVRAQSDLASRVTYFGLDLTGKGLSEAVSRHSAIRAGSSAPSESAIEMMYYRFDLDRIDADGTYTLPLADASVDRICCSLLISYLKDPVFLLRELKRVLKPGGRVIVSSMKPHCDMSQIYKGYLDEEDGEDAIESARNLLSAAGVIQLKEDEGYYVFYSEDELLQMLQEAGFSNAQVFRSFGNQANLAYCVK